MLHAAGWTEGGLTMGYEKFVLDAEQCGAFRGARERHGARRQRARLRRLREVGPGKHFLGAAHTMRNYETAFYESELSDSNSYEQWSEEGSLDSASAREPQMAAHAAGL